MEKLVLTGKKLRSQKFFSYHRKKPRAGFLCEEEKGENREIEKIRRKIESVFARPKNCFKILREKFRMRVKKILDHLSLSHEYRRRNQKI
jgi:hypothetical protein